MVKPIAIYDKEGNELDIEKELEKREDTAKKILQLLREQNLYAGVALEILGVCETKIRSAQYFSGF